LKSKNNPHVGSNFDDFLREEGIYEEVEAAALKKVIAMALTRQMKRRHVSVSKLAGVLGTSRAAISRVLDEHNTSITLTTLSRTATALGCKVRMEIVAA
jgi:antitoxin HicB